MTITLETTQILRNPHLCGQGTILKHRCNTRATKYTLLSDIINVSTPYRPLPVLVSSVSLYSVDSRNGFMSCKKSAQKGNWAIVESLPCRKPALRAQNIDQIKYKHTLALQYDHDIGTCQQPFSRFRHLHQD